MRVLFRLAGYGLRYRRLLILAWICLLGANLLALALPRLLGMAIDHALADSNLNQLLVLALVLLVLSVARGAFSYGQTYLSEAVSHRVGYDLRNALLKSLQHLSFAYHDRQKTGDLMSRATYDVESTRMFISFGLVRFLQLLVLLGAVTPLLLLLNWKLGFIAMSAVPITVFTSVVVGRKLIYIWVLVQQRMGTLTTVLQENLSGIRVVKAFGAEEHEKARFREHAYLVSEESFKANRLQAINSSFLTLMFTLATGLVIWYGGNQVINAQLSPGELTQFVLYLGLLVMPVRMLGWAVSTLSRAVSSGERIFEVLDADSPVHESKDATTLTRAKGRVTFNDVSFSYNPMAPSLHQINLDIWPGQKVAILGAPGSGKSTIVNLIPRFYDPSEGTVSIDGVNIKAFTLESLRRNVGIVFQDVFLFHTSIRGNIAYGANGVSPDQIEDAARAAQLHDFIASLPKGYDTAVGERGVTLSGGQRQRLAIARTLLLDPPILVLDDSTSSVDSATEAQIQKALARVMQDRTTFIIAHRISSVRAADLILVMDGGAIVAQGTHEELLATDGFYRQIYELQLLPAQEVLLEPSLGHDGGN